MRTLALSMLLATLAGCGPRYTPLSAHTIDVSADVEKDVIWVLRDGETPVRCSNTDQGPVCVPARTQ